MQSSNLSDKTAEIAMVYRDRVRRANEQAANIWIREYDHLSQEMVFLEECIDMLPDSEYVVIKALVLEGMSWDQVECRYAMSRREIAFRRNKALEYMVRQYQKRASQLEAEILA